ncbi:MAG: mannose-6-phosphate isomerase, class I [Spirochaetota bacterium]
MNKGYDSPVKLENAIQNYPWGSPSLIPDLLGVSNQAGTPYAEMWMGSHPRGPSKLAIPSEIDLNSAIQAAPQDFLGPAADRFPEGLPFLFKVLAAAQPLSIQAHPNRRQAREGFAREEAAGIPIDAFERNYRDKNHKPEIICALTPFTAMCGFRAPAEIRQWYRGIVPELYRSEIAPNTAGQSESEWLQCFFENVMNLSQKTQTVLIESLHTWAESAEDDYIEAQLIHRFYEHHGVNVGVQAPLFLNVVELEPGQALYQPAGVLHAYVQGMGVELMANSDNVLRGGLTKKHVDLPELLNVLSFEARPADILQGKQVSGVLRRYPVPIDEFELQQCSASKGSAVLRSARTSIEIGICTSGELTLATEADRDSLHILRGESFVVPYAAGAYRISGQGDLYLATIPGTQPSVE